MEIDTFQKPEKENIFSEIFSDFSLGYLFKWNPICYNMLINLTNCTRYRYEDERQVEAICYLLP